jgi:carbamoyl-phosphate synthase large subunit
MPKDTSKIRLIIGSGPMLLVKLDYAGSQSARSIREGRNRGYLINSNPATIMTDPSMADHIYLKPLTTKSIIEILKHILKLMLFTNNGRTNSFELVS